METNIIQPNQEIQRADLDLLKGHTVLEFGASWCGYCQAARPLITSALAQYHYMRHIKIEDGKGQRLGRSYAVKLWPTLIFLKDGVEVCRLVRPNNIETITDALHQLTDAQTQTAANTADSKSLD